MPGLIRSTAILPPTANQSTTPSARVIAWLIVLLISAVVASSASAEEPQQRFDPKQARKVRSLAADRVRAVQFSPDESQLVTASYDDDLRSFDTRTWQRTRNLQAGHRMPDCFSFAPHDSALAASAGNASLKIWDFAAGRAIHDLSGHNDFIFAISFSPDGKLLASAAQRIEPDRSATSEVILWDVASGARMRTINQPTTGMTQSIAFSPDGRLLACGGATIPVDEDHPVGVISVWEVATGDLFTKLEVPPGEVQRVLFSPNGREVAVAVDQFDQGAWAAYDLATGRQRVAAHELPAAALDLDYSPDGRLLAVAISDQRLRGVVAMIRGRFPDQLEGVEDTYGPGLVTLFDINTGDSLGSLPHVRPVHRLCFSPSGKYLATGGYDINTDFTRDLTLHVWELFPE